jgi:hypothetical protein
MNKRFFTLFQLRRKSPVSQVTTGAEPFNREKSAIPEVHELPREEWNCTMSVATDRPVLS